MAHLSSRKRAQSEALNSNDGTVCRYADGGICDCLTLLHAFCKTD